MVLYGNNKDGLVGYNYCRPHTDPYFGSYHSLVSIAYSGCDEKKKLKYEACQHEQKVFNAP